MTRDTFEAICRHADEMRVTSPDMADLIEATACALVADRSPTPGRREHYMRRLEAVLERLAKEEQR